MSLKKSLGAVSLVGLAGLCSCEKEKHVNDLVFLEDSYFCQAWMGKDKYLIALSKNNDTKGFKAFHTSHFDGRYKDPWYT